MASILSKTGNKQQGTSTGDAGQGISMPIQGQPPVQNASGNFTNISNYLRANQGAGARIGTGLAQKTASDLRGSQMESDKQVGKLGSDIGAANTTLNRGTGYQQELGKKDFDAQKFLSGTVPGTNLVAGTQPGTVLAQAKQQPLQAKTTTPGTDYGTVDTPYQPVQKMTTGTVTPGSGMSVEERNNPTANSTLQKTAPDAGNVAPESVGVKPTSVLEDFTKFRTGTAISGQDLNTQKNAALSTADIAQRQVGDKTKGIATEQGRFGLLKDFLGNNNYRQGLQSLDQSFLQTQGQKQLQNIQKDLQQRNQALAGTTSNVENEQAKAIGTALQNQTDLSKGLGEKTSALETGYINDLQGQVAGVNTQRDAERARNESFYNQLYNIKTPEAQQVNLQANTQTLLTAMLKDPNNAGRAVADMEAEAAKKAVNPSPLDAALLKEAGLNLGEQTFNVFKQPTAYSELFNVDAAQAKDYRDVASQKNVDYYKALSDLAGIAPAKLAELSDTAVVDPITGEVKDAASVKTGEGGIRNRLDKSKFDFLKQALDANMYGQDTEGYDRGFGRSNGEEWAGYGQNVANLLGGGDQQKYEAMMRGTGANEAILANGVMTNNPTQIFTGLSGVADKGLDAINNLVGWNSGGQAEAKRAAHVNAYNNLQGQISNYLSNQGFQNYLGESGVKQGSLNVADYGYGKDADPKKAGVQKDYQSQNLINYLKGNVK